MNKQPNRQLIGVATIAKGNIAGKKLVALDFIGECPGSECKLFVQCQYVKSGPCRLRRYFLYHVLNTYIRTLGEPDTVQLNKIGALLMPLWDQLIRFKMEEASIKDIMPKATINPIYSAIRETIKTILRVEGECLAPAQRGSIPIPDIPEDEHNLYGDPNFYRELTDADMEEELELDI